LNAKIFSDPKICPAAYALDLDNLIAFGRPVLSYLFSARYRKFRLRQFENCIFSADLKSFNETISDNRIPMIIKRGAVYRILNIFVYGGEIVHDDLQSMMAI
jgi:hypothetical protein